MRRNIYLSCALAVLAVGIVFGMSGCGKKKKITYGDIPGVATGKIDLSGDKAVIDIDNIKSELGEDIDYTSKLDVTDGGGDYTVDVNASNVKNDVPGTYNVGYTIRSDRGTYTSNVKVTVTDEKGVYQSADDGQENNNNGAEAADGSQGGNPAPNPSAQEENNPPAGADNPQAGQSAGSSGSQGGDAGTGGSSANNGQAGDNSQVNGGQSDNRNQAGNSGSNTQNSQTQDNRVLIPGDNKTTYKTKNIENAVIELLSGDVVTISCSTNKYIVETRTDVSTVMRNGHNYEVSKLIVVFNTGAQRTLETVEKKID